MELKEQTPPFSFIFERFFLWTPKKSFNISDSIFLFFVFLKDSIKKFLLPSFIDFIEKFLRSYNIRHLRELEIIFLDSRIQDPFRFRWILLFLPDIGI